MRLFLLIAAVAIWASLSVPVHAHSNLCFVGRVVDCSTSRPVPDAGISVDAAIADVVIEPDGRFRIYGLPDGEYKIRIEAPAYLVSSEITISVNGHFSGEEVYCLNPRLYLGDSQQVTGRREPESRKLIRIDRDSPEFQSAHTLSDVLDFIPQLMVNKASAGAGEASISVRGGPSKEVLVMLDGVSVNSPVTGVADLNSISLSNVESIEFYEGGSSSLFGAGAVGGVLHIVSSTSHDRNELECDLRTGKYDFRSWQTGGSVDLRHGLGMSAYLSGHTSDNDFMFDDQKGNIVRRENADFKRSNVDYSGKLLFGQNSYAGLTYHRYHQSNGIPGFIYQLNPYARKGETRDQVSATLNHRSNSVSFSSRYSFKYDDQTYQDTFNFFKTDARYVDRLHQLSADASVRLQPFITVSCATAGAVETFEMENHLDPSSKFDDVHDKRASYVISASRDGNLFGARNADYSVYLRLRGDYSSLFEPMYSPAVGMQSSLGMLGDFLNLRGEVLYGKSYRAPLYSSLFWDDGVTAYGNPNLKPERLEESSASLGFTAAVLGEMSAHLHYSHSAYRDLIHWVMTSPDNRFSPRNLNGAVVYARTMQLLWRFSPANLMIEYTNTDQLSKDRSWERTHHDLYLTFRPRYMQYLVARYSSRWLDLEYRLRSVSKRYIREANTKWLDGYTVSDIMAAFKHDSNTLGFRIQYNLNNISDREYMLTERSPQPGQTWSISTRIILHL